MDFQTNNRSLSDEEMLARYECAQTVFRGKGSTKIARNSTLFPGWIGDTNCFWYARDLMMDEKSGREFRLVNAETATNEPAFDHDLLGRLLSDQAQESFEANSLPISNICIRLNPLRVEFTALDQSWLYNEASKTLKSVYNHPKNWVVSPDGKQAVFTREYNLWLHDIASGEEKALTSDGEQFYDYATGCTVWGKELPADFPTQALWSPDGKTLLTLQKDRRKVKTLPTVHHIPKDGSLRPQLQETKIAYPGDKYIEEYRLIAIDVSSGRQQPADYHRVPAVTNNFRGFFSHGYGWWCGVRQAYFIDIDRYSQRVRVVAFDTQTGATRIILEETSSTHLAFAGNENLTHSMQVLTETDELIWYSERSGYAHFYLYDLKTGDLKRTLTSGDWRVRNSVRFDPKRRELFLTTSGRVAGRNPYYRDLVRVNIDTAKMVTIADGDYECITACPISSTAVYAAHAGVNIDFCNGVSATGDYAVVTRSRVDTVPETLLFNRDGEQVMVVETAGLTLPKGWVWPEPVQMKAADGETDIYGVIYKPTNFDPAKTYPVIDAALINNPVSSPVAKGSFTNSGFYGLNYYGEAALAQLGFVVVHMDGRGTAYRNKAFHDASYGFSGEGNKLEDHVAGLQQLLNRYAYMDNSRVGIVSLTAGTGAAMGLLLYPDFYTVGAGIQVYDGRLKLGVMGEDKFIGPKGWAAGTRALEDQAGNLKGKLLQCVALSAFTDSIPASSLRIIHALQRANKDIDVVVESVHTHGITNYQMRRIWDHMVRHLQGNEPPKDFILKETSLDGNG